MVNDNKPNDDGLHRIKRQVQQNFGRQALAYNANCLLADEENLNTIIRMAGITGREGVLDLATGTGFLAAAASPEMAVRLSQNTSFLLPVRPSIQQKGLFPGEWYELIFQ